MARRRFNVLREPCDDRLFIRIVDDLEAYRSAYFLGSGAYDVITSSVIIATRRVIFYIIEMTIGAKSSGIALCWHDELSVVLTVCM